MVYRNLITGYKFATESEVTAPNWIKVGAAPAPKKAEDPAEDPEPTEEPKKPATKKKPAKKGAKK